MNKHPTINALATAVTLELVVVTCQLYNCQVKLKTINHHAVYHPVEMVDNDVSLVLLIKTIIL